MSEPARDPHDTSPSRATDLTSDEDLLLALADDFGLRLRRGDRVTAEDYAAKHPQIADRIRKTFPAIALIEERRSPDSARSGDMSGSSIGRYKLLERIGEGGFGVVYMAEQLHPVRRKVAVKVIKPGVDTRQVIARFEAERQALALMDHENIARVLDAGATDSGQPYFVMELVHGVPITVFCDQSQLPPRERLELFVQVCRAVQHAHTKGIIHRDIKPTNVLVTLHEGVAVPKVIDFGVAKATGQQLTDLTLFTNFAQMVGTPLYMSPEQAEMTNVDVDTRSDIYSLGVLLYELLTGTTPLDKDRLKQAAFDEVRRIIREEEPPRPSTRLSTAQSLPSIAAQRRTEPTKLAKLLRGELDWIIMKALEKERSRRYETANGFAMDVQRYLADEPVYACPPSTTYRLKKLVRRNRGPVFAAALLLLTLAGGIIGTGVGLVHAQRARRAEAQRADGERQAKQDAQKRLAQIEKGTEILASVFRDLDPKNEQKEGATLRVLLGQRLTDAVKQLDGDAVADPLVVARLQHLLGISLRELGHLEQAEATLVKASQTRERLLGADHVETAATKHNLAQLHRARGRYAEAEALYRQVLEVRAAKLGADHDDTLGTKNNLALVYMSQGKFKAAEPLLRDVLATRVQRLGPDDLKTLQSKHNLAGVYEQEESTLPQAVALLEEVLEGRTRKLRRGHPDLLQTQNNLAHVYSKVERHAESEALSVQVAADSTAELGPAHPFTLLAKHNLAVAYGDAGKHELAAGLLREVLDAQLANPAVGPRHHYTALSMRDLAATYDRMDRFDLAIPLYQKTVELSTSILGPDHPDTRQSQSQLGVSYVNAGRDIEGIVQLEAVMRKGRNVPNWDDVVRSLVIAYARTGDAVKAKEFATEEVRIAREKSVDQAELEGMLGTIGKALLDGKFYAEAEPLLREAVALREKRRPAALDTHFLRVLHGAALSGMHRFDDAEPIMLAGYKGMRGPEVRTRAHIRAERSRDAQERLVQLYDAWGKPDEAKKWRTELDSSRAPDRQNNLKAP